MDSIVSLAYILASVSGFLILASVVNIIVSLMYKYIPFLRKRLDDSCAGWEDESEDILL